MKAIRGIGISVLSALFVSVTLFLSSALAGPLHGAVATGDINQVERLIAKGADVNAKDNHGFTPLHFAAERGDKDIAELLIVKGANIDAKNQYGTTPLHL